MLWLIFEGYRRAGAAVGPSSSFSDFSLVWDPAQSVGVSGRRDPGATMSVSGGHHGEETHQHSEEHNNVCKSCNVENHLGGRFCSNCGAPMEQ